VTDDLAATNGYAWVNKYLAVQPTVHFVNYSKHDHSSECHEIRVHHCLLSIMMIMIMDYAMHDLFHPFEEYAGLFT
jgi:hypothetical protein